MIPIAAGVAIIANAGKITTAVQGLLGGKNEQERLANNERAYQAAVGGDPEALQYLLQRSGKANPPIATVPRWSPAEAIGGWATASAKADADSKYNIAKAQVGLQNSVTTVAGRVVDAYGTPGASVMTATEKGVLVAVVVAVVLAGVYIANK